VTDAASELDVEGDEESIS
jgi:hypothetical protein